MLTLERISQIKDWLGRESRDSWCPFHAEPGTGVYCREVFPDISNWQLEAIRKCGLSQFCPCIEYGVEKVVARAEEVVRGYFD